MTVFETIICSRCGGTGHYSYCETHGTRCFECEGTGMALTTRGKAARAFFNKLRETTAGQVEVGMRIRARAGSALFTVTEIVRRTDGLIDLRGKGYSYRTAPENKIVQIFSEEQRQAQLAEALAYQATL